MCFKFVVKYIIEKYIIRISVKLLDKLLFYFNYLKYF